MFDLSAFENKLQNRPRRILEIPDFRPAAVLVAILLEPEPSLILTKRTSHLKSHSGQIAFAGGSLDALETPVQAALREAHEEIGLEPSLVRVLGLMSDVWTPVGFHVTPVVGLVSSAAVLHPNPSEVAQLLFVPLSDLHLIKPTYEQKTLPTSARVPTFETRERAVPHYLWQGHDIWGMTAFVIQEFLEII
jgi:8-oxo-dGTP pyrophosphatase MutT (NUDIX family)